MEGSTGLGLDGTGERVVVSEHLEVLAVAPGAAVGGHQPVEGPVPASKPGQPDPHDHPRSLLVPSPFRSC